MVDSAMEPVYEFYRGSSPLLISIPHAGIALSKEVESSLNEQGKKILDTDWYVDRLYAFAKALGVSVLKANYSRYVIDLNRSSDGMSKPLYSGINETGLCPVNDFDESAIYQQGMEPKLAEINDRIQQYWLPYHNKIAEQIERNRLEFGYALLWDAHSIKSHVPRFFNGQLQDFNLGSHQGASCDHRLSEQLFQSLKKYSQYTSVLNGRFTGGYITRHYGQPEQHVHAVQLELSQRTYMDEGSLLFSETKAREVKGIIKSLIEIMLAFNVH